MKGPDVVQRDAFRYLARDAVDPILALWPDHEGLPEMLTNGEVRKQADQRERLQIQGADLRPSRVSNTSIAWEAGERGRETVAYPPRDERKVLKGDRRQACPRHDICFADERRMSG